MGIFKKTSDSDKKLTKEDVIKAIEAMSDEEQSDLYDELLARAKAGEDETADKGESETEKQIEKAEEDIAEKGADSQTEKDRIDESVGEQERRSGDENSQNAKDRVDESEGTKKADEERAEKKKEEGREDDFKERMLSFMERIEKRLDEFVKRTVAAADADTEAAKRMEETYGIGNGVFQGSDKSAPERKLSKEEIASKIAKIM